MALTTTLTAAVAQAIAAAAKLHAFLHNPATGPTSDILTDQGNVPSLNKIAAAAAAAAGAGVVPFTPPVAWAPGLTCVLGPPATAVTFGGESYYCNTPHLSGATFAADAAKWTKFAAKGDDATASPAWEPVIQAATLALGLEEAGFDAYFQTLIGSASKAALLAALGIDPTSHIRGLTYANNGADATNDIDVAAGSCMSDDGTDLITIAATTKQLDVAAAADNGATPSGMLGPAAAIGNNDYALYAIKNPTTGECRVFAEKQDTAPTLPSGFTKKRQFGFIQRVAGAIAPFTTFETAGGGLEMYWTSPAVDFNHANVLTNSRRTDAVRVPRTFSVLAHVTIQAYDVTTGTNIRITRVNETDAAVTTDASTGYAANMGYAVGVLVAMAHISLRTSATGTIAARVQTAITVDQYNCSTSGFTWSRR